MAVTLLEKLINPEVMADMISAELEDKLQATRFYKVNRTLTGRAGDTITVPTWHYIGQAEVLAENEEGTVTEMTTEDISYTVKKVVKNVTLTDEAVLSGFGDPVGQANMQLRMAIQDRMENDGIELLQNIPIGDPDYLTVDEPSKPLSYSLVVDAIDTMRLEEQDEPLYILVGRAGIKTLRKDERFTDLTAMGDRVILTGAVGTIAGATVVISNRIDELNTGADTRAYVFKPEVFTAFMKRDINLETARGETGVLHKRTLISSDAHYVIAIEDYEKVVAIKHKK